MPRHRLPLIALVLASLACNFVTGALAPTRTPEPPPSATRAPTRTREPLRTPAPQASPSLAATPTAEPAPIVYVPPACQGLPLATLPPATTVAQPTPSLAANPEISTEQQLAVFDDLAEVITEVYLYPDFNGLDWPATVARYRAQIEAGLDTETFYVRMQELVIGLGDEHSYFESPLRAAASEAEQAGHLEYVGIGVLYQPLPEKGSVTILAVMPDSPAEHSGLKPHDSLLAVDGLPIVENGEVYANRVRGPECSAAVLTVQSPGQPPRQVTLVRARISGALPVDARLVPTRDGSRIGYIFLATFFDDTIPGQVRAALEGFGPLDGLIIDNRMNGGGSSRIFNAVLGHFISGTLGQFVSRSESRPLVVAADPIHNSETVPLVVLVGEGTASFGEIFSGVLQDAGRATIVGQTTDGNVETLHGYSFDDGSWAWIAQERFEPAQSQADWERDGIVPEVEAYADWDTFTFETDPSVAAAVRVLGHE